MHSSSAYAKHQIVPREVSPREHETSGARGWEWFARHNKDAVGVRVGPGRPALRRVTGSRHYLAGRVGAAQSGLFKSQVGVQIVLVVSVWHLLVRGTPK